MAQKALQTAALWHFITRPARSGLQALQTDLPTVHLFISFPYLIPNTSFPPLFLFLSPLLRFFLTRAIPFVFYTSSCCLPLYIILFPNTLTYSLVSSFPKDQCSPTGSPQATPGPRPLVITGPAKLFFDMLQVILSSLLSLLQRIYNTISYYYLD
jgi:hypothetical protein